MKDLETERLVLHPLTGAEARRIIAGERAAHWADGYPDDGDAQGARRFLAAGAAQPFGAYEIRRRDDGRAVGGIAFHGPADESGAVTVGYGLIPSTRGRGYAAEALRALLVFARDQGVATVKGDTDLDNAASQRVMAAAGMQRVNEDDRLAYYEITWAPPRR